MNVLGAIAVAVFVVAGCASGSPPPTQPPAVPSPAGSTPATSAVTPADVGASPTAPAATPAAVVASPTAPAASPAATESETLEPTHLSINGKDLFAECAGSDEPPIVFLHGNGADSRSWGATIEMLGTRRTCVYDRVNAGRSERTPGRIAPSSIIDDLHAVLDSLEVKRPIVLVGHSFGGEVALQYAGTYPAEVAGVVMADGPLPFETELDPPETFAQVRAELNENPENVDVYEAYAETAAVLPSLPDVPITYLAATRDVELPSSWPDGAYLAALEAFMDSLPQGRLVLPDSSHNMPHEIPDVLAEEIERILEAVGSTGG